MFQIGKLCSWKGAVVLHATADCKECSGLPDRYAQIWPDGVIFNGYIVAMPRAKYVVKTIEDVVAALKFKFLIACRKCERRFKSEDGAYEHLRAYHGVELEDTGDSFDKIIKEASHA